MTTVGYTRHMIAQIGDVWGIPPELVEAIGGYVWELFLVTHRFITESSTPDNWTYKTVWAIAMVTKQPTELLVGDALYSSYFQDLIGYSSIEVTVERLQLPSTIKQYCCNYDNGCSDEWVDAKSDDEMIYEDGEELEIIPMLHCVCLNDLEHDGSPIMDEFDLVVAANSLKQKAEDLMIERKRLWAQERALERAQRREMIQHRQALVEQTQEAARVLRALPSTQTADERVALARGRQNAWVMPE